MARSSFDAFWRTLVYNRDQYNQPAPAHIAISFGYWYMWKKLVQTRRWEQDMLTYHWQSSLLKNLSRPFEMADTRVLGARNFFISEQGRIGWAPFRARAGDRLCIFQGMRVPGVVRAAGNAWEFIGGCYIHGLMDGEAWDLVGEDWEFVKLV
jgi:hypothetical protein